MTVRRGRLVALDVVAWGLVHAATGFAVHRLPSGRLGDGRLYRLRAFERDGDLYRRAPIRIHRWKDMLPEAGALFAGGVSKRHVPTASRGGLERFVVETRRAELGHWAAAAAGPLFALWNPPAVAAVHVAYGLLVNLPFVAIQRYNRARAQRILGRRSTSSGRTSTGAETRSGRSMP